MARDFDGVGDRIGYTLVTGQHSIDTITYACWIFMDSNGEYRRPFHLGTAFPNQHAEIEFDDALNGFVFYAGWTTAAGAWYIAKPATGAWTHLAITYNWGATTNDPVIYINGVSQSITEDTAPSGTKVNTSTTFAIGGVSGDSAGDWDGRIAEFAFWNRVLTAAEISSLGADAFSPLFYPSGLVFYTPLIGRSSTESDLMKGIAGTVTGAVVIAHPRIIYPSPAQIRRFGAAAAPEAAAFLSRLNLLGVG